VESTQETENNLDKNPAVEQDKGANTEGFGTPQWWKQQDASPNGLDAEEANRRLEQYGPNQLEEKRENPILKFLSFFWGPIAWMIEVAAILSIAVGHIDDFIIVVVMLVVNAVIGFWQEFQAANAVEALKKQLALKARVKRTGRWQEIEAAGLVPGDVVRLRLGDIVPADVVLTEGDYLSIDQSALTGESLPVDKSPGDTSYSGSVVKQGEMEALVTHTGANTYFGKTTKLVSSAKNVSHFQKAVLTIGNYLIYLSLGLAVVLFAVMLLRGASPLTLLQFALILVVAAIPVAMPAVLSVTMAIGAQALAKMKAIVTRLVSIEEMAGIDILCSDKTGTLTQNKLTLRKPEPMGEATEQDLIVAAALASKSDNRDAIDDAILGAVEDPDALAAMTTESYIPFDPVKKRSEAHVRTSDGAAFGVTKGAPQVILSLCKKDADIAKAADERIDALGANGFRTLGVARDDGEGWRFLGLLPLYDPPREDSFETIRDAQGHGIKVKMVTGDNVSIAKQISGRLGMGATIRTAEELFRKDGVEVERHDDKHVFSPEVDAEVEKADGFAQVFPEDKFNIVTALQERGHIVGMTGDGVNDAPALKKADVGIAVSGATDAARAAASLVLTAPGLSVIVRAVEGARRIFERMNSYAIYRIIETIRIMFFVALAMIFFNVYPITTVMIIVLALLNDLPIITIGYDNTWLEPNPVRWEMRRVLSVSTVLGLIGVIETFGLFVFAEYFLKLDIAQLQSFIFLKLAVAGHLTLLVARTKRPFLTKPYPAPILLTAVIATKIVATLMVGFGLLMAKVPWTDVALIWAYCIAWVFIEDWAKLGVYRRLDKAPKKTPAWFVS